MTTCAACGRSLSWRQARGIGYGIAVADMARALAVAGDGRLGWREDTIFVCLQPSHCGEPAMRRWLRQQCTPFRAPQTEGGAL